MIFSIHTLRGYLQCQFSITPEQVWLPANLRTDLHLTDDEVKAIIGFLTQCTGMAFAVDKVQQLTDVSDLMVYVLLRSQEETDTTSQVNELDWPFRDKLL